MSENPPEPGARGYSADKENYAKRLRRTENGICLITQPMIDKLGL